MTSPIDGSRDQAALTQRISTAVTLRNEGKTWQEVADATGYGSRGAACRAVLTHLGSQVADNVVDLRAEANSRHASKIALLEEVIYDPEASWAERIRAADAHTRAEARHARLNGMDAPLAVVLSAGVEADLADALAELDTVAAQTLGGVHQITDVPDRQEA